MSTHDPLAALGHNAVMLKIPAIRRAVVILLQRVEASSLACLTLDDLKAASPSESPEDLRNALMGVNTLSRDSEFYRVGQPDEPVQGFVALADPDQHVCRWNLHPQLPRAADVLAAFDDPSSSPS